MAQAEEVRRRLMDAHGEFAEEGALAIEVITTSGDRIQDRTLAEIGGKGLFTKEIEEALLAKRIDAAVHSMKDVPTWLPDGLEIAAILPREDPRDALFAGTARTLAALPQNAVVGTASLRRQALVLLARPDVKVVPLRGNVGTRLRKLADGQVDATLLAVAGLKRLGRADQDHAILEPEEMLPAVAQGAIGLEIRQNDARTREWLAAIHDEASACEVAAERACLEVLDGSCRTPIAALARLRDSNGALHLRALVAWPDGSKALRAERRADPSDAAAMGRDAGAELRAAAGADFFEALGQSE